MRSIRDVSVAVCGGVPVVDSVVLRVRKQRQHELEVGAVLRPADGHHPLQAEHATHALGAGDAGLLRGRRRQAVEVLVGLQLVLVREARLLGARPGT